MTPQQTAFTLPATLYRYQPGPGYRQGLGVSAPLPGLRSSGLRIGTGASRHRPGPLQDTPKDHGELTYTPTTPNNPGTARYSGGKLTFIGERTTRTWDLTPTTAGGPLQSYFLHTRKPSQGQGDILYLQTTQRQTVEGLATAPTQAEDPDPTAPTNIDGTRPTLQFTLENLLFNTPPTPAQTPQQARQANHQRARKTAFGTALAALALIAGAHYLAHTPSLPQQAGACDTQEEIAAATAAGRALEAEAYTAAGRTRPSDARLYTYTNDQEGC